MNSIYKLSILFLLVISVPQDISSQEETKKQNTGILKFPANIELVKMYSQKLKVMRNFFKKKLRFSIELYISKSRWQHTFLFRCA